MCATGDEVGTSHRANGFGEKSRKDKTAVGNDGPEATIYSALTVESLTQRFTEAISDSLYGSWFHCDLVAYRGSSDLVQSREAPTLERNCGFKIDIAVQVRASLTLRAAAAMGFPEIVL
jgi:hypothetical protein